MGWEIVKCMWGVGYSKSSLLEGESAILWIVSLIWSVFISLWASFSVLICAFFLVFRSEDFLIWVAGGEGGAMLWVFMSHLQHPKQLQQNARIKTPNLLLKLNLNLNHPWVTFEHDGVLQLLGRKEFQKVPRLSMSSKLMQSICSYLASFLNDQRVDPHSRRLSPWHKLQGMGHILAQTSQGFAI